VDEDAVEENPKEGRRICGVVEREEAQGSCAARTPSLGRRWSGDLGEVKGTGVSEEEDMGEPLGLSEMYEFFFAK
jgi:hypothetical protein